MNLNDYDLDNCISVVHSASPFSNGSVNVLYMNVRSIANKLSKLKNLVNSLKNPVHLICLSESWLNQNILNRINVNLDNYCVHHSM